MDSFHERLARLALEAGAGHGFRLAGGYAVQAPGATRQGDGEIGTSVLERGVIVALLVVWLDQQVQKLFVAG